MASVFIVKFGEIEFSPHRPLKNKFSKSVHYLQANSPFKKLWKFQIVIWLFSTEFKFYFLGNETKPQIWLQKLHCQYFRHSSGNHQWISTQNVKNKRIFKQLFFLVLLFTFEQINALENCLFFCRKLMTNVNIIIYQYYYYLSIYSNKYYNNLIQN